MENRLYYTSISLQNILCVFTDITGRYTVRKSDNYNYFRKKMNYSVLLYLLTK